MGKARSCASCMVRTLSCHELAYHLRLTRTVQQSTERLCPCMPEILHCSSIKASARFSWKRPNASRAKSTEVVSLQLSRALA